MVYANDILAGRNTHNHGFAAVFAKVKEAIAKRRLYAHTIKELSQLTDRELADLGLHHGQIHSVAHNSVYGPKA